VHTWYPSRFGITVEPLDSTEGGVATGPETATAVAVRLEENDTIRHSAPCGLADPLDGVCCRNPRRVTVEEHRRRLERKQIPTRWPHVRVLIA
jgi:hypothetical protein